MVVRARGRVWRQSGVGVADWWAWRWSCGRWFGVESTWSGALAQVESVLRYGAPKDALAMRAVQAVYQASVWSCLQGVLHE